MSSQRPGWEDYGKTREAQAASVSIRPRKGSAVTSATFAVTKVTAQREYCGNPEARPTSLRSQSKLSLTARQRARQEAVVGAAEYQEWAMQAPSERGRAIYR